MTGVVALSLLPCEWISGNAAAHQDAAADQAQKAAQGNAKAAYDQIRAQCKVNDAETDPKKIDKQSDCVLRAIAAQKRKIATQRILRSTLDQSYGVSKIPAIEAAPAPGPANAGASSSETPSTCGPGTGANNPFIRVHRLLMAPKNASDDFGYRLGRRFIVYQITISNDNKDYQYLIHDVSLDLSPLFLAPPGTYRFAASSQDLTLLRGVPEKGQDLDPRNLTYHVLQGIGSVAGAVSGLTAFSDVMGSSVAAFNGPFLQSYVGIAPDHTGTQLNRLSDSAYITNTVVDKQRAKTIAMFIPEATILSKPDQRKYWKDPYEFLQGINLNQADVCVDGAFIATVAPLTLTSAVLTPTTPGSQLAAGVQATLTVQGTNLTAGDTQVIGFGTSPVTLTTATGTTASATNLALPADYKATGIPVHLASATNPTLTSATISTTVEAPTLTKAVLTPTVAGTPLAAGVPVTLKLEGTNLTVGDTQVIGLGIPPITVTLTIANGTTGTITNLTLPPGYVAGVSVQLASIANPTLTSAKVATSAGP